MKFDNLYRYSQQFESSVITDEDDEDADLKWLPEKLRNTILENRRQEAVMRELALKATPLRAPMKGGGWCMIHKSTKKPGFWQASYFDQNDEPWGDSESQDFGKLLYHASGNGIIWTEAQRLGK
jgi:hypothetical protein